MSIKQFGSYYWRGNSLYVDYSIPLKNGCKKRKRFAYASLRSGTTREKITIEKEARRYLNQLELQIRNDEFFENDVQYPTYKQIAHFFWEKIWSRKKYIREDNCCYASDWSKLQLSINYFGNYSCNEIKRSNIKQFRISLKRKKSRRGIIWSASYINRIIAMIGQVYKAVIVQEIWEYKNATPQEQKAFGNIDICVNLVNPCHGLPRLKEIPKQPLIPSFNQFVIFLNELPTMIRYMALTAAHTGLRKRNILGLLKSQVDRINWNLIIDNHKGSPPLIIAMHNELVSVFNILFKFNKDSIYVFSKDDGEPYRDIRTAWNNACERVIPGFQFKHIRNMYTSWLVAEGVEIGLLQHILGHTTVITTSKHYNKAYEASKKILESGKQRSILGIDTCGKTCDGIVTKTA